MTSKSDGSTLRAVSYCRTSGESQRDNTSIPSQRAANERFIASQGWLFVRHYVDESLTGSKIEGREEFQRMMRDAANDQFDVIVPWDVTRFARDGCDIVNSAKFLRTNYGVHVVDAKGQFDNRDCRRALTNFVLAGVAEDERLRILERTMRGRIANAEKGLPWCGERPTGRTFIWKDERRKDGHWAVTERGKQIRELLERYVEGESLRDLEKVYGIKPTAIHCIMRESCLSGTYVAEFHSPDVGIDHHKVPVPSIPELITPELERRVRDRMEQRRCWNRESEERHRLTGFVHCSDCGRSLVGHTDKGYMYYRHKKGPGCSFSSIHHDVLEKNVLDFLYAFIHDEPTYEKAVQAALPSDDDRTALEKDIREAEKRVVKNGRQIANITDAIADGVKLSSVLHKLTVLENDKKVLDARLAELRDTLAATPTRQQTEQEALWMRFWIMQNLRERDWSKLPFREVRAFLRFLFSDNPTRNGYGIFLHRREGQWHVELKGRIEFSHDIVNGRPVGHWLQTEAETESRKLKQVYREGVERAREEHERALWETQSVNIIAPDCSNVWLHRL